MIGTILAMALREIRRNTMRSALTALGIVTGVAAVIVMVTLGQGASAKVTSEISALGRNLLIVSPGSERRGSTMGTADPFELEDIRLIEREISGVVSAAPTATRPILAVFGNQNWATTVTGVDNAYLEVREWSLATGRSFTEAELQAGKLACVLGETVRQELFGSQDAVGTSIRLGNSSCLVVGALQAKGQSTFGADQDDFVLVPIRAFHRRIAGNRDIHVGWISAGRGRDTAEVKSEIEALLRQRRRIPKGGEDDFVVRDMKEIAGVVEGATGVLTALLGAIAAVSLLVGGIGIMNIMLVSVTERTREIGIRLAIGALEGDVLVQFLIEAVVLSSFGGLAGIALGLASSAVASHFLEIPFVADPAIIAIAFFFSGAVGVGFGYFPARKAARLDPIEALRYE